MEFPFGPWLPDQTDFKNPGLERAENAIPSVSGYRPARDFVGTGTTIAGTIIGAGSVYLEDGAILIFCATTTDLHVIRSGTATASGLSLALATSDIVQFEQYSSAVYATTKNGDTWVLADIESSTTFVASPGSPPSANAIGRIADFLVMGDLVDIDASDAPYRLRWSRFNNPQGTWDTNIAAQSGAKDLDAKYGPITAITGGASGLVFQRQGITRISFVGGQRVFRLDTFEENRGCVAPASTAQVGESVYYLAHDGFFRTDGTTPVGISTGKVWQWFLDNCNQTFLASVAGAVDYQRRCIIWLFPGGDTSAYTVQIWYNWETEQWGYVRQALDWAIEGAKSGVSMEQLALIYPNLDTMPLSLDSPEFLPSGRNLQVFRSGELGNVTGSTLRATFTSGDMQPLPRERSFVSEVHPLIEADNMNVRLGTRNRMVSTVMETPSVSVGPAGFAPFNTDARYFRVIIEVPAGEEWANAYGYQIKANASGAT